MRAVSGKHTATTKLPIGRILAGSMCGAYTGADAFGRAVRRRFKSIIGALRSVRLRCLQLTTPRSRR